MRQDTLQNRISYNTPLTEEEIDQLVILLGTRCRQDTKERLRWRLSQVPHIHSYGIYGRVMLSPVSYCAGQSYPDEIRTIRHLILNRS